MFSPFKVFKKNLIIGQKFAIGIKFYEIFLTFKFKLTLI